MSSLSLLVGTTVTISFFKLSDYVDTVFVKYTKYEIVFFPELEDLFTHVLSAWG